jgi:hypothetical protein
MIILHLQNNKNEKLPSYVNVYLATAVYTKKNKWRENNEKVMKFFILVIATKRSCRH